MHTTKSYTPLDTRDHCDAILCGYDRACDPHEDGEGLVIEVETTRTGASATLWGCEGQVTLHGSAEIHQAILALQSAHRAALRIEAECWPTPRPSSLSTAA